MGCIIVAAGLVGFFWTELGIGTIPCIELMVLGVVVSCLRDPKTKKRKGGTLEMIAAIFMIAAISACATEQRCAEKYSTSFTSDSLKVEIRETVRDTIIYVPGDSAVIYIANPCDILGNLKPNIFERVGSNAKSKATVVISPAGIKVNCECKEEYLIIKQLQREIDRLQFHSTKTKAVYKEKNSFWSQFATGTIILLIGYLLGAIGIHKLIFKR